MVEPGGEPYAGGVSPAQPVLPDEIGGWDMERFKPRPKGELTVEELLAFKKSVKVGGRLNCCVHKRKGDDPERIIKMRVKAKYPCIVVLEYPGKYGMLETSITWQEACLLNRKARR